MSIIYQGIYQEFDPFQAALRAGPDLSYSIGNILSIYDASGTRFDRRQYINSKLSGDFVNENGIEQKATLAESQGLDTAIACWRAKYLELISIEKH